MPIATITEDPEAEKLILGACLLEGSIAPLADLADNEFSNPKNREIFYKLKSLHESQVPINTVELTRAFSENGHGFEYAAYISSLPDAVPIVQNLSEQLEAYRARLRKLTDERSIRKETAEIGREDATVDEIRERAERIVEKAKPKAKGGAVKGRYPDMPKEAWHPAAEMYRAAVGESTEASDTYHLACFLTIVGAALGRTIYVRKGRITYPNLFTVLVGRSGARKGTAMDLATELLNAIDSRVYFLDSIDSKESSVKELSSHQAELYGERWTYEHREMLVMEDFGSLIDKAGQKATSNIMKYLCRLYDCPKHEANKAETSKAEVKQPTMSVMSATSESYLEPLTIRDIQGGVGNRVNWVGADPKARKDDPPDPNQDLLDELAAMIRARMDFYRERESTRFHLSPAATKRHKKFYEVEYNPRTGDEMMEVLGERDAQTALKVAMIYAALDKSTDFIEIHHLEAAIAYVGFLYTTRIPIFSGHGLSQASAAQQRIIEIIQRDGAIPLARLQPLMRRNCDATLLEKYLRSLSYAGGPIRLENHGRKIIVMRGE